MKTCLRLSIAALAIFLQACAVTASGTTGPRFLKEEPYRKVKQRVDVSSVKNERDLAVVSDAIDTIMKFVVSMSFTKTTRLMASDLMTEHGRSVLNMPPIRNEFKRYSMYSINNWKICGDDALSFDATYSDLLQRDFWSEKYMFVKMSGAWRFDDHLAVQC
jgi:hypothetical protein